MPPNNTQPDIPQFTGEPGLKIEPDGDRPVDYYQLFLSEILDKLSYHPGEDYQKAFLWQEVQGVQQEGHQERNQLYVWTVSVKPISLC